MSEYASPEMRKGEVWSQEAKLYSVTVMLPRPCGNSEFGFRVIFVIFLISHRHVIRSVSVRMQVWEGCTYAVV